MISESGNISIIPKTIQILLVEDEILVAIEQKNELEKHGYSVITVSSGNEAIQAVESNPDINLVLMDINLGRGQMDAAETAEMILKDHDIPILFLSNHTQPDIERTERIRSCGFIIKDSGENVLNTSITMALDLYKAHEKIKQSEQSLSKIKERLELAQQSAGIGIWDWDIVNGFIDWTPEMFGLFGLDQRITTPSFEVWRRILHPGDRQSAESGIGRSLKEHSYLSNEYRIIRPDGEIRWINALGRGVYDDAGNPVRMAGTCIDITDRKRTEEELRKGFLLTESIPTGLYLYHLEDLADDRTFRMVYANPAAKALTGVRLEDVVGRTLDENFPALRAQGIPQHYADVVRNQTPIVFETFVYGDDRVSPATFSVKAFPLPGDHIGVAFENITAHKQAEEALKESEENWRSLVEAFPECILVHGEGIIRYVNPAGARILGCASPDEAIGRSIFDIVPENSLATAKARIHAPEKDGMTTPPLESEFVRFDGGTMIGEARGTPILYGGKRCVQVILRDVTELKLAEDRLSESEQDYKQLVQNTTAIILRVDLEGRIKFINDHALDFFGYTADEILGRHAVGTIVPAKESTGRNLAVMIDEIVANPDLFHTNTNENMKKSGERVWLEWTNSVIFDKNGKLREFLAAGIDITKRRQAENTIRQANQRLRTYFESSLIGTVIASPDKGLLDVNDTFCSMLGYSRKEILRMQWPDFTYPEDLSKDLAQYRRILSGESEGYTIDKRYIRKDGQIVWAYLTVGCVRDFDGTLQQVAGLILDITGRKRAEEAIRKAHDDLERRVQERTSELKAIYEEKLRIEDELRQAQKMEAIGTLAGGIAHDFNNILAAILGFTEMAIEDACDHPVIGKSLRNIHTSAIRARDLVKQILVFSRKTNYDRTHVSLSEIVRETTKFLRATIPATIKITLDITVASDTILASSTEIQQILMNLASNAAIAMEERGGTLQILLSDADKVPDFQTSKISDTSNEYVQLAVKDTGIGIDPDIMNRIFDPFFTTRSQDRGTGMGLAVVYGIVTDLKGTITVESKSGIGSTFRVFLPKIITKAKKTRMRTSRIPTGTESILFIDDEDMLAEWAKAVLEKLGYRAIILTDPTEALNIFASDPSRFDLVITDQSMPSMSGMHLAGEILTIRPDIPIILCTGHSATVSPEKAKDAGIKHFLMKPVARKEFAQAIRRVLDTRGEHK